MVLITGATGLVGSYLALDLLENNEPVRAIFRDRAAIEKTKAVFQIHRKPELFQNIEWVKADITDIPSLELAFHGITEVYHCAALISFDPADEKKMRKINIEGTANVVNCCLAFGVRKLVHVSSIAALGELRDIITLEDQVAPTAITEATEWNPEIEHSDYAISKYGGEMEVWRGWQEGLQVAVVNPGVILGAGFWNSGSGEIFTRVRNGLLFYTQGITGFVSVNDVVKMLHQLMKSDVNGERFIAISENISFEDSLRMVARSIGVKGPRIAAQPWLTSIAWKLDWLASFFGRRRQLSRSMAHSLHKRSNFSSQKAKEILQFEFEPIPDAVSAIGKHFPKKL